MILVSIQYMFDGVKCECISSSPLKVKEDDEVDNLDIKLEDRRKTKRIYQSSAPEVNLKISRSLKVSQPLCFEAFSF